MVRAKTCVMMANITRQMTSSNMAIVVTSDPMGDMSRRCCLMTASVIATDVDARDAAEDIASESVNLNAYFIVVKPSPRGTITPTHAVRNASGAVFLTAGMSRE